MKVTVCDFCKKHDGKQLHHVVNINGQNYKLVLKSAKVNSGKWKSFDICTECLKKALLEDNIISR